MSREDLQILGWIWVALLQVVGSHPVGVEMLRARVNQLIDQPGAVRAPNHVWVDRLWSEPNPVLLISPC